MMNLANTKSQLAKLMATENITVQHKNAPTASFDVKNRVLTLPILKDDLSVNIYDLMTSHEVGHALWTPEDGWHDAVCAKGPKFKTFLNIVEDARIEKKIKIKYPGLAGAYRGGYKELLDMDFFGLKGVDIEAMPFIDRVNLHFKLGTLVNLKFEGEEAEWIEKIGATDTFEEVMALTEELFEAEKEKAEQQLEEEMEQQAQFGQNDDDQDEEETETDGQGDAGEEEENDYASSAPGDMTEEFGDETGEGSGEFDYDEEFDDEEIDEMPVDAEELMGGDTDENQRANEGQLTKDNGRDIEYMMFGTQNKADDFVIPYKKVIKWFGECILENSTKVEIAEKTKNWRANNQKIINYMVKEFEMKKKADEFKRAKVSKSGELDMKKVFGYKFNDDLFKKVTTVQGGKNHGFVMYLDWSGSMASQMAGTIDQLLNLVMFCRKVKIPFEVYAFSDAVSRSQMFGEAMAPKNVPAFKDKHLYAYDSRECALITLFDSAMSLNDFNSMIGNMMVLRECLSNGRYYRFNIPSDMQLGGTPLDTALLMAPDVIEKFKKKTKAQIVNFVVLTDGDSHSCGLYDSEAEYMRSYYSSYRTDQFVQDTVTKKTYKVQSRGITPCLIEAIGDRCGVNTIGFYLVDNRPREIRSAFSQNGIWNVDIKEFRKAKFKEVTTAGYDSYFILAGGSDMVTGTDEGLDVGADASKAKIRSAFMKAASAKTANRVLLGRLMDRVAA